MARVAQFSKTGGPEVIDWIDVDLPPPGPGEVRFRSTAVGLPALQPYIATDRVACGERSGWHH